MMKSAYEDEMRIAESLVNDEKYGDAIVIYKKILGDNPSSPAVRAFLGYAQYQLGLFQEAIENFDYAISVSATPGNALFCRAVCKEHLNDLDGAISDYQESLKIREDAEAITRMAAIYEYRGDLSFAKSLYERALRINPEEPMAIAALNELRQKTSFH